ncbi:DUF58 domain-containing protein [Salinibacterium sp. dk2585]|uniref:DUF58 domain-containing protein n=1 Tax=unclassified Salinibacterium TaxID=2632331 RepID=UPI0011C2535C|nr:MULTISPECIES: DUF58 domain-containing protein [unclassified Salinibacterium]QEE60942.1 DUF58 domain-containing protein [Salinibacterium sp. dk2585]TXK56013.1 DUF58 domain-containing protein [Salinibacterium sp. dk5596]
MLVKARRLWRAVVAVMAPIVRAVWRFLGPILGVVTSAGWIVLGLAILALVLSATFGWQEFTFLGTVLLAALLVSTFFLFGRASYGVHIELNPRRVVVGQRAMGRMLVTNTGTKNLPATRMELPVGRGVAEFQLPAMQPREEHEELFAVPTHKRAVIVAGPAESVKGDQLGLMRRALRWADPVDLFVHPRTVRLAPTAAGLVRDLEGQVSKKITSNDIAFHALRPYVPGDDRRYVHWRTSARIGQLMVRQFEETRRSQLTMIHATRRDLFASEEEFELAVSVTASIASQVIADGTQMDVVSESGVWRTQTVTSMLDSSSRIEPVGEMFETMRDFARQMTKRLPAPSVVMIVAGSRMTTADFRSIQSLFGSDTSQVAFRVEVGAEPKFAAVAGLTLITIGDLDDLPKIVRGMTP